MEFWTMDLKILHRTTGTAMKNASKQKVRYTSDQNTHELTVGWMCLSLNKSHFVNDRMQVLDANQKKNSHKQARRVLA